MNMTSHVGGPVLQLQRSGTCLVSCDTFRTGVEAQIIAHVAHAILLGLRSMPGTVDWACARVQQAVPSSWQVARNVPASLARPKPRASLYTKVDYLSRHATATMLMIMAITPAVHSAAAGGDSDLHYSTHMQLKLHN